MKVFSIFRVLVLAALMTAFASPRAVAQPPILTVSGTPNPVQVSSNLTFTIGLTNISPTVLSSVFVTNTLPAGVTFLGASVTPGAFTNTTNQVVFNIGPLSPGQGAFMVITGLPTLASSLTNFIDVISSLAPLISTNVIVVSSNNVPPVADLAVSVTSLPPDALLNDWLQYAVTVTNLGPSSATGVVLSNSFSSAVRWLNASPTNQSSTNTTFIFDLGTLTNGASAKFKLTFEPTNSGPLTNIVFVGAPGIIDPNLANNTAGTNVIMVADRVDGVLKATNLTPMVFNPQDSLMEQTIRLVNISSSNAASARVVVAGLTTNRLYNLSGTNSLGTLKPNPSVSYIGSLGPGESVDLVMEYVVTNRLPFDVADSNYFAYALPPFIPTTTIDTNAPFIITSVVLTPLGHVLIEFQSTPGSLYTIFYSPNSDFSGALPALPDVTAQADRTQWLDDGPPKTISKPLDATSRYYRVRHNPPP